MSTTRMGRPPLPPGKVRSIMLHVRVTPGERRQLYRLARQAGETVSAYLLTRAGVRENGTQVKPD